MEGLDRRRRDALPEAYRCALDFVDQLVYSPDQVTDQGFAKLRAHFTEFEIVELCYFVLYQNIAHRFGAAMGLEAPETRLKRIADLYVD